MTYRNLLTAALLTLALGFLPEIVTAQDGDVPPPCVEDEVGSLPQDGQFPPPVDAFMPASESELVQAEYDATRAVSYELPWYDGADLAGGVIASTAGQQPQPAQQVDVVEAEWYSGEIKRTVRTYRKPNESSTQWAWRHGHAEDAFQAVYPPNPDPTKPLSQQ